jgi:ribosomal protein L37AE/L43A
MSAGWLYYHKYPQKRKCPKCGKRQYLKRIGVMSNGADVWALNCKCGQSKMLASDWPEGGLL